VLPRIFDPFYTTKEAGQGTGLGLSIAQQIAVEHGGRIEVENRAGQGVTFTIALPAVEPGVGTPAAAYTRDRLG
jgi:two-component system, NtrC family, sensor kinase